MSDAVAAIGAAITIDDTPVEEPRDITGIELSRDEVDVTNHSSPGQAEEVLPTILRYGAVSFPMNGIPGATGQAALFAALEAGDVHDFEVTYTNGVVATFPGFVRRFSLAAAVTDINMVDVEIRPTQKPDLSWGS